jgi:hypothetical protein
MPNALNSTGTVQHRILVLGETGSGKTTQILTLPGKKYAYLFDSNAILSLRGYDVDFDEYLPDRLNLAASSLSNKKPSDKPTIRGSNLYQLWESDFNQKLESGFFDSYDWLCMDSCTTFLDLVMDRILTINGRFGEWPQVDDYGPQMLAFTNVCRSMTAMGKGIYFTGHLETKQDELTKRIFRKPMLTGRLAAKIPLLFSDIFVTEAEPSTEGKIIYKLQTKPDRLTTTVRTAIRGLDPFEDVTVNFAEDPVGQGLGGLLQWEAKQLEVPEFRR